jgi:WD40 repeat protein/tetratricopeptide (TPR) repeat protein
MERERQVPNLPPRQTAAFFHPDGERLTAATIQGELKTWSVHTGENLSSLPIGESIGSRTFSPDHRWLAVTTLPRPVKELSNNKNPSGMAFVVPRLLQQANLFRVHLIDARTAANGPPLESPEVNVSGIAFSGDGRRLAACSGRGAKVWDVTSRKKLFTFDDHDMLTARLAFSHDGRWLVTASDAALDGAPAEEKKLSAQIKLHDLATGKIRWSVPYGGATTAPLVFSPDGGTLVTPGKGGTLLLWGLPGCTERLTLPPQRSQATLAGFSKDSTQLATSGLNGVVYVWDARTGRLRHTLRGHTRSLASLVFSPDGRRLVSSVSVNAEVLSGGRRPGEIKVWDLQSGREMLSLDGQGEPFFSPDGRRLAGAGKGHGLCIWDSTELTPEEAARRRQAWMDEKQSWHEHRAEQSEAAGQHLAAIFHLGELIRMEPKQSRWYVHRGEAYIADGDLLKAIDDFTHAIELGPEKGAPCYTRRGVIRELLGHHEQAIADLTAALRRGEPGEGALYQRRGEAFLALGQPERATADFTEALRKDPQRGICWAARGEAHAIHGKWKEAGQDLDRVLAINPGDAIDWDHRLLVHLASGQIDDYRKMLAKMIDRFAQDSDPETAHDLVIACIRIPGAVDELTLLRLASAAVDPNATPASRMPDQRFLLGAILYRTDRPAAALVELQAAEKARAQPSALDSLFTALANGRLGKKDEARAALRRAVEIIDDAERNKTMTWQQRITRRVLREEVETLLNPR